MTGRRRLDELIAAARERPPVAPAQAEREGWARLQRSLAVGAAPPFDLGPGAVVGATASGAKATLLTGAGKWIMVAALGTGAGTVAVVRAGRGSEAATPVAAVRDGSPHAEIADAPAQPLHASKQAPVPTIAEAAPATATDPIAQPSTPVDPRPPVRAGDRPPRVATPPAPAATKPQATLDAELSVIRSAQRALADGDPQLALDRLAVHARVYPGGAMKEDRAALRVLALCRAGRTAQGRAEQADFVRTWPHSLHAARVRGACGGDG